MPRYHTGPRPVVDSLGTLVVGATVAVYKPGTTTPIPDTLYSTSDGVGTRPNPFTASDGDAAGFYLDTAQVVRLGITLPTGGTEKYIEDIPVGPVFGDDAVEVYGARNDGTVADNYDALTEAFATCPAGGVRQLAAGGFYDIGTCLARPNVDGFVIKGPGGGGTNRLPGAVIRAKPGSSLPALMATTEWLTNHSVLDTGQGFVMRDFGLWGGHFTAGSFNPTTIETAARTNHGLVAHGSGGRYQNLSIVSANGHGIEMAGVGEDGSTPLEESHENIFRGCNVRYTGLANIHGGVGFQDGTIDGWTKLQYAGTHCIDLEDGAGWSIVNTHPSWAALNLINILGAWECSVTDNYLGSVGKYMDGLMGGSRDACGVYIRGYFQCNFNRLNANAPTGSQVDPIVGYNIGGTYANFIGNQFTAPSGTDATFAEYHGFGGDCTEFASKFRRT